jgi:hypothetical protein
MYQYTEERDEHGSVDAGQKIVVAVVDALQIVQLGEAVLRYLHQLVVQDVEELDSLLVLHQDL